MSEAKLFVGWGTEWCGVVAADRTRLNSIAEARKLHASTVMSSGAATTASIAPATAGTTASVALPIEYNRAFAGRIRARPTRAGRNPKLAAS